MVSSTHAQYLPRFKHDQQVFAIQKVLADSSNGFTWNWKLYTGKEDGQVQMRLAERVVSELVNDDRVEGKGYIIVTDNFYSSPLSNSRERLWSLWYGPEE